MYELIEIRKSNIEGKGVFAKKNLHKGILLTCDVAILNKSENISLKKYLYPWDINESSICLGFGSFLNHSNTPNTKIKNIDKKKLTKTFIILHHIRKDEELTIKYSNTDFNSADIA